MGVVEPTSTMPTVAGGHGGGTDILVSMRSAVCVVLAACVPQHNRDVSLDYFSAGGMTVGTSQDGANAEVNLWMAGPPPVDHCPVLAGAVEATVDGVPPTVSHSGGYYPGDPQNLDLDPPYCDIFESFEFVPGASSIATSQVVITDGTTTFSATVPFLRTVRALSVGSAQRGMDATFVWSVPADTYGDGATSKQFFWTPDQGTAREIDGSLQGTTAVIAIPAAASPGPGTFTVDDPFVPAVASCDGLTICKGALLDREVQLRATIAP
jgi:hypothetical protein